MVVEAFDVNKNWEFRVRERRRLWLDVQQGSHHTPETSVGL